MEIVERSSGYWIVDEYGVVEGPFDEVWQAQEWIDNENKNDQDPYWGM